MPFDRTITSATATLSMSFAGLYPSPRTIQGWASNDFASMDAADVGEAIMGIDGHLSFGFVYVERRLTVTLNADSTSNDMFENVGQASQQAREAFVATGTLIIPATGRKYNLNRGFLMSYSPIPTLQKTIAPRPWTFVFESITGAPVATTNGLARDFETIGSFIS